MAKVPPARDPVDRALGDKLLESSSNGLSAYTVACCQFLLGWQLLSLTIQSILYRGTQIFVQALVGWDFGGISAHCVSTYSTAKQTLCIRNTKIKLYTAIFSVVEPCTMLRTQPLVGSLTRTLVDAQRVRVNSFEIRCRSSGSESSRTVHLIARLSGIFSYLGITPLPKVISFYIDPRKT